MKNSLYNFYFNIDNKQYLYNSKNNGIVELEKNDLEDDEVIQYLCKEGYFVDETYNETEILINEINDNILKEHDSFDITIALTNACNFNCTYCYQDKNIQSMTFETASDLLRTIKEIVIKEKYKVLNIHYFGGEPLLNLQILLYFDQEFQLFSAKHYLVYKSYLTTNGSLINKYILDKVKFHSIQLTFDGFEQIHNDMRISDYFKYKDQIDLISLIESYADTKLVIRMNACKNNEQDIIPFFRYILDNYKHNNILLNLNRMIKFHKEDSFDMLSGREYAKLEFEMKLLLKEYGFEFKIPIGLYSNCKFICNNAFSITVEGKCSPCSGDSNLNLDTFSEEFIKCKKLLQLRSECTKCKFLPLCLGGCIKQYNAGYDVCIGVKYNLEQIIKEYIMQLPDLSSTT